MSQNNFTLIQQTKKDIYEVSNRDADTGEGGEIYLCKTLEEAVKKANELERECWLGNSEYGITINLLKDNK
jgi:hypothetical protein